MATNENTELLEAPVTPGTDDALGGSDDSSSSDVWDEMLSDVVDDDTLGEESDASSVEVEAPVVVPTGAPTQPENAASVQTPTALPSVSAPIKADASVPSVGVSTQTQQSVQPTPAESVAPAAATPQPTAPTAQVSSLDETRKQYEQALTNEYEQFIGPDVDILDAPQKVLAKIIANAHINITNAIMSSLVPQLPHLITVQTEQVRQRDAVITDFVNAMPEPLRAPQYRDDLMNMGRLYKQMYPQSTIDQIKEGVKMMAATKYAAQMVSAPVNGGQLQAQSAVRQGGFRPAGPGGSPGGRPVTPPDSVWAQIQQEFLHDDQTY